MEDQFEKLFDRFDRIARKNVERWVSAAEKVQAGNYKADDYVSDVVGVWFDSTIGWLSEGAPILRIRIVKGIAHAHGTLRLPEPAPAGALVVGPLSRKIDGPNPVQNPTDPIAAASITAELGNNRKTLAFTISNLAGLVSEVGALYACSIQVGNTEIAKIEAVVKKG